MAKRANDLSPRFRPPRVWLAAVSLGVTLSACSHDAGIQTAPLQSHEAPPASRSPSLSKPPTSTEAERLVTQRYVDFQRVAAEAGATSNADDHRLVDYATGAVLKGLRGKLAVRRQAGTRLYGRPVPHVKSVTVLGDRAMVMDCLDNSATGLVDRAGKKLSVGRDRQETTATLIWVNDTWKVSAITTVAGGGSC